jgi:BirA family biotin operon repressor/biotin-[acetyl-CoA-carboxylase] ligase
MQHPLIRDWSIIQLLQQGQPYPCQQIANLLNIKLEHLAQHFDYLQDLDCPVAISNEHIQLAKPLDLLDIALMQQQLGTDKPITLVPVVDSTNTALLQQAKQGVTQAIFLAEYQTQGYGQHGRKWQGNLGQLLMMSLLQRFRPSTTRLNGLSLVIGLAIVEALTQLGWQKFQLKWPNDILYSQQKLGGILIETLMQQQQIAAVIGIGLNVYSAPPISEQPVTCLANVPRKHQAALPNRSIIAATIIQQISDYIAQFTQQGLASFLSLWQQYDGLLGKPVKVVQNHETIIGVAQGINTEGALLVEIDGKLSAFTAGEVQQVRTAGIDK